MVKNILVVILIIFTMIFSIQNVQTIEVKFLYYSITLPRAIILLATLLLGVVIGYLIGLNPFKSKEEVKDKKESDSEKEEVAELSE